MRKLKMPALAGVLCILFFASTTLSGAFERSMEGVLTVAFLDVGQGDAIFIESPSGAQVLIDGGKGSDVQRGLGEAMGYFDRTIDMVIATHGDLDHVGGLVDVLDRYDVGTVVMTENDGDAPAWSTFKERVKAEGAMVRYARRGQVYDLGMGESGSTTLSILFPDRDPRGLETNTASIVAKLSYGDTEVMLMADAPVSVESYLVSMGGNELQSDVLKVGHHGSRTSTSPEFLSRVAPALAVISAGKDNTYGHPHEEIVELLSTQGAMQKNTADEGSIFLVSDGNTFWFK